VTGHEIYGRFPTVSDIFQFTTESKLSQGATHHPVQYVQRTRSPIKKRPERVCDRSPLSAPMLRMHEVPRTS